MPEHPFRAIFGTDLAPVRAKDIAAKIRATDPVAVGDPAKIQGKEVELSTMQYAEALASFKPLLDYAHELDNKQQRGPAARAVPASTQRSRRCWCGYSNLTAAASAPPSKSSKTPPTGSASKTRPSPRGPTTPRCRCRRNPSAAASPADSPSGSSQTTRGRARESVLANIRRTGAQAARCVGMLDPKTAPSPNPAPTAPRSPTSRSCAAVGAAARASASTRTANRSTSSTPTPTTTSPTTNKTPGTRGYKVYMTGISNGWCNQRIILDFGIRDLDITEGDNLIERVALLQRESPEIRDGLQALTYDRMIKPVHVDGIYDLGIVPIVGTSLTNKSEPAAVVLHHQKFHCLDGKIRHENVRLLHTTPTLDYVDGNGYPAHQPLRRIDTYNRHNSRRGGYRWYNKYEVPDNPNLGNLSGATTTLRINSTSKGTRARPAQTPNQRLDGLQPHRQMLPAPRRRARKHRVHLLGGQDPADQPPSPQRRQPPHPAGPSRTSRIHHSQRSHTPLLRERHRRRTLVRPTRPRRTPPRRISGTAALQLASIAVTPTADS